MDALGQASLGIQVIYQAAQGTFIFPSAWCERTASPLVSVRTGWEHLLTPLKTGSFYYYINIQKSVKFKILLLHVQCVLTWLK